MEKFTNIIAESINELGLFDKNKQYIFTVIKPGFLPYAKQIIEKFEEKGWKVSKTAIKQLLLREANEYKLQNIIDYENGNSLLQEEYKQLTTDVDNLQFQIIRSLFKLKNMVMNPDLNVWILVKKKYRKLGVRAI